MNKNCIARIPQEWFRKHPVEAARIVELSYMVEVFDENGETFMTMSRQREDLKCLCDEDEGWEDLPEIPDEAVELVEPIIVTDEDLNEFQVVEEEDGE